MSVKHQAIESNSWKAPAMTSFPEEPGGFPFGETDQPKRKVPETLIFGGPLQRAHRAHRSAHVVRGLCIRFSVPLPAVGADTQESLDRGGKALNLKGLEQAEERRWRKQ